MLRAFVEILSVKITIKEIVFITFFENTEK